MSALRAPVVARLDTFDRDVAALREKYPSIDVVIEDFTSELTLAWNPPHVPVDPASFPGVCAVAVDYPPKGSGGRGILLLTYHVGPEAQNKMSEPLRTYTLLTIGER